jgi:hypothetical protein
MDDGEPPVVEFLDAQPAPGSDELLAGPTHDGRTRTVVLAGTVLVIAAGVLTVRLTADPGPPSAGRSAATAAASAAAPRTSPSQPPLDRVPALRLLPTPPCRPTCLVLFWVADAALNAVDAAFPGAVTYYQMSAFTDGQGGPGHPLMARELRARAGSATIVVDVVRSTQSDGLSVGGWATDRVRAEAEVAGYRVVAQATNGGRISIARMERLVQDPGVLAVR